MDCSIEKLTSTLVLWAKLTLLPYFCLSSPVRKWQQCLASWITFPLSKHCFLKHCALFWNNYLGLPSFCGRLVRTCMKPREINVSLYELSQNMWLAWVHLMTEVSENDKTVAVSSSNEWNNYTFTPNIVITICNDCNKARMLEESCDLLQRMEICQILH